MNLDLEAFDPATESCLDAAQSFVSGWSNFFVNAGVYGSTGSTGCTGSYIQDYAGISNPPQHIWGAFWDENADTTDFNGCLGSLWGNNQRLKQYRKPHYEVYDNYQEQVDGDSVDGPLWGWPPT